MMINTDAADTQVTVIQDCSTSFFGHGTAQKHTERDEQHAIFLVRQFRVILWPGFSFGGGYSSVLAALRRAAHAIGDEANEGMSDIIEVMTEDNGSKDRRRRLVHAQVFAQRDFEACRDVPSERLYG